MEIPTSPTYQDLTRVIATHYPSADTGLIKRAFAFAEAAHGERKRHSGEPYLLHPIATAIVLAGMRMTLPVVTAGLLHDVLEDTPTSEETLRKEFGADITSMVVGVTKLGTLKYRGIERYAENLRKMFLAMASDIRIVFIKFADRLHNLTTLEHVTEEKRKRIALESLEIYAPIANRLGMGSIRGEIEDLAFKYVLPKEYTWVREITRERIPQREKYLEHIKKNVEQDLKDNELKLLSIHGRTKHLWSLYKKLLQHDRDITKIYDLVALRMVLPTVADCYAALGTLHQRWKPLKGRIKDYIAQPKPNGYQSLHTTVFCENGECVEFQFRTQEMHEAAELGVAAHWQYTESGKKSKPVEVKQLVWLRELAKIQQELKDPNQFLKELETLKVDLFQNRIFVFTPKGDVIDLPEGATPVDYAYAVHSEVGNHCAGAKVNDQMVALSTSLKSGDLVEIITDKNRKGPSPDWLKFVKTHNARDKIKTAAKSSVTGWLKQVVSKIERK